MGNEGFSCKGLFGEEKMGFLSFCSMFFCLGEGINLLMEDWFFA